MVGDVVSTEADQDVDSEATEDGITSGATLHEVHADEDEETSEEFITTGGGDEDVEE